MRVAGHDRVETAEEAGASALAHIRAQWRPDYEPAVVDVEDAGISWRVFYNDEKYLRTKAMGHTLIDNWPLLVDKASGAVEQDKTYRPLAIEPVDLPPQAPNDPPGLTFVDDPAQDLDEPHDRTEEQIVPSSTANPIQPPRPWWRRGRRPGTD